MSLIKKLSLTANILIFIAIIQVPNLANAQGAMNDLLGQFDSHTSMRDMPYGYITDAFIADTAKRQGTQTECDRLTANKHDIKRTALPVKYSDINADKAISTCRAALDKDPSNARLMLNLARAYNKNKNYDDSFAWTKESASKGHSYAYHVLSLHYNFGEGVKSDRIEEEKLLQTAISKDVKISYLRLANVMLEGTVSHVNFTKIEKLIHDAGYIHDSSSATWGRFYHIKSKKLLSSYFFSDWKQILKDNNALKIKYRLKPSELREYTNALDSSIQHYSDFLTHEKDKKIQATYKKLKTHRAAIKN